MPVPAKRWLILIGSDPRLSGRPAEAVRIAAGVGAWNKVQVSLFFAAPALPCLGERAFELVDGELFERYLPLITARGGRLFVEEGIPELKAVTSFHPVERVDLKMISNLLSGFDCSMRF